MSCTLRMACLAGLSLSVASGCASMVESKAIEHFTMALKDEDLAALENRTSPAFRETALRSSTAMEDLKIFRLPTEDVTVAKIEDVTENEKQVTVKVGESKQRLLYRLVRKEGTDEWVIDDIHLRQKKDGLTVVRSVSEQMDLLLSVRELLDTWSGGQRDQVLATSTPRLRSVLEPLPAVHLDWLTNQLVGESGVSDRFRPDVQMEGETAVVRLQRPNGKLLLSLKRHDMEWKVEDAAIEAKQEEDQIASILRRARAITTALSFLDGYSSGDRSVLQATCVRGFYRGSLESADLSHVPLPDVSQQLDNVQLRVRGDLAELMINTPESVVTVSMQRQDDESVDVAETLPEYLVDDVTIYELKGTQEIRLSALFTAEAVMQIFSDAIARQDLTILQKTSTADFRDRVWSRMDKSTLLDLMPPEIESGTPKVLSREFSNAITEITVMQGRYALTYVLRDQGGEVRVDDVLMPVQKRPESLKTTLDLMIPVRNMAVGLKTDEVELLQRHCSADFNRLIWSQVRTVPSTGRVAPRYLTVPLSSVQLSPNQQNALLTLGNDRYGARVLLERTHGQYVVDEVLLIGGVEASQRAKLKHTMKVQLANGGSLPSKVASGIQHAGHTSEMPGSGSPRAVAEAPESVDDPSAGPIQHAVQHSGQFGRYADPAAGATQSMISPANHEASARQQPGLDQPVTGLREPARMPQPLGARPIEEPSDSRTIIRPDVAAPAGAQPVMIEPAADAFTPPAGEMPSADAAATTDAFAPPW